MKSLQLVKYDLISILKSPYTYLAFILVIGMTVFQASMMANYSSAHKVNIDMVFNLANWLFLFAGLLSRLYNLSVLLIRTKTDMPKSLTESTLHSLKKC